MEALFNKAIKYEANISELMLSCTLLISTFLPFLSIFVLLGSELAGHYNKFLNSFIVLVCVMVLCLRSSSMYIDTLSKILFLMMAMGVLTGLAHGIQPHIFISHFFVINFIACIYILFSNSYFSSENIDKMLNFISNFSLYLSFITTAIFWTLFQIGFIHYPGFSAGHLVIPCCYFLVRKKYFKVALAILLTSLSAKRGVYVALFGVFLLFISRKMVKRLALAMIVTVAALILSIITFSIFVQYIGIPDGIPVISTVLGKLSLLNFFSPNFNVHVATAGRSIEILDVWQVFSSDYLNFITGLGYGWSYVVHDINDPGKYYMDRHYVHFSYFNILLQYGFIVGTFFLAIFFKTILRYYQLVRNHYGWESVEYILFLIFAGSFFVSLSGYSISIDPVFWMIVGFMASRIKSRNLSEMTPSPHIEQINDCSTII